MKFWNDLYKSNKRCFIQSSGQGSDYKSELMKLNRFAELKYFFNFCCNLCGEWMNDPHIKDSGLFRLGFDLKQWIENERFPDDSYFKRLSFSMPLILMTQLAYYHLLITTSISQDDILELTAGTSGHSQGIFSSIFIGLNLKDKEYWNGIRCFLSANFYMGFVVENIYKKYENLDSYWLEKSMEMDSSIPSPMVSVTGIRMDILKNMIDEFNGENNEKDHVTISLTNTPMVHVISGHRNAIVAFRMKTYNDFQKRNVMWEYTDFKAPYHNKILLEGLEYYNYLTQKLNWKYMCSDLVLPVYSTYNGANLQNEEGDLKTKLYHLNTSMMMNWPEASSEIFRNPDITHILDLGPGASSTLLTKQLYPSKNLMFFNMSRKSHFNQVVNSSLVNEAINP